MGEVITFYSYKGGVGRTMALANVAVLLSKWKYKVLIVDWDLEAPGLEFFFKDFLSLKEVIQKKGIIELLCDFSTETAQSVSSPRWKNLCLEIQLTDDSIPLSFLTAGKRDKVSDYFGKVSGLDLEEFYSDKNGGLFIEYLRNEWKQEYDFILIDSRTGITDIGGICTVQLPDLLVLFFTATEQSLQGTIEVAKNANLARQELPVDRYTLLSLPILSRFDAGEEFKISQEWLNRFDKELSEIYAYWLPLSIKRRDFIEITKIPYLAYFSFGEKLPVLEQGTKDPQGLGYIYETISALIANNKLGTIEELIDKRSQFVKSAYAKIDSVEDFNFALTAFFKDQLEREELIQRLKQILEQSPDSSKKLLSHLTTLQNETDKLSLEDYNAFKLQIEQFEQPHLSPQMVDRINLFFTQLLSPEDEIELAKGRIIRDSYRLEEKIAEDDERTIWKAIDLGDETESSEGFVALKFVNQELFLQHPEILKNLIVEFYKYHGKKFKKLRHHNIVRADDLDRFGHHIFSAMAFCHGVPLKTFITQHPNGVSLTEAKPIITGLIKALAYAHQENMVGLNVAPGGIFYDQNQQIIKLVIFDLILHQKLAETRLYASYEVLSGLEPDNRDDIYALACVSYELLSGTHPFERKTAIDARGEELAPKALDNLSVEQNQALLQGLALQRNERMATVDEFLTQLFPPRPTTDRINLFITQLLSPEDEIELTNGTIIRDSYRLEEKIAEDDERTIWIAVDLGDETESSDGFVALKFVSQEFFRHHSQILKTLVVEFDKYHGKKFKKLRHHNIVRADDLDRFGHKIFTAMAFIQGISLETFIKKHPTGISITEAEPIITSLASILAYAHQEKMVGLNVAPGRIFYDQNQQIIKLVIFDLVPLQKLAETNPYVSYEILSGLEPDNRDDIYALSCVIYELLSGTHPFDRKTAVDARGESLAPKTLDNLSAEQNQALLQGLALQRNERMATVDEFLTQLFPPKPTTDRINLFITQLLSLEDEIELTKGTIIRDSYRLEEKIVEDDKKTIWKAVDLGDETESSEGFVTLKFVNQELFRQYPKKLKQLVVEFDNYHGKKFKKLRHHNIVRADDLDRFGHHIFSAMAFCHGVPLKTFINKHPTGVSLTDAKPIITGLIKALAYAHQENMVGLNVEPGRIFYDQNQQIIKLVIFDLTLPQKLAKTKPYVSYEVLLGLEPDNRDDVYALACVTYELLSGKHPYDRRTSVKAKEENLFPQPIKGLKRLQNQALLRGLAIQREERTLTVKEFLSALFPNKLQQIATNFLKIFSGI
jgi:serine/threonine protein kinase